MKPSHLMDAILTLAILIISGFYLSAVPIVPFHPDESTQIFMSQDFDLVWSNPSELTYHPGNTDIRQNYRLLDAPLTRYMIGFGRMLFHESNLVNDWDWTKTWLENRENGALPDGHLLTVARFSVAWLFPFSLAFAALASRRISGWVACWFTVMLFASNALILLHTRRAMAESVLVFAVCLNYYLLTREKPSAVLLGMGAAIAMGAKQSLVVFMPVNLLAIWIMPLIGPNSILVKIRKTAVFLVVLLGVTYLINPVGWKNPLSTTIQAWNTRQELTRQQEFVTESVSPGSVMTENKERMFSLFANLYISSPALADVRNYIAETASLDQAYLGSPWHTLGRNPVAGTIMASLSFVGFLVALFQVIKFRKHHFQGQKLIIVASIIQLILLSLAYTIPFQRYVMPLIPISTIWTGGMFALLLEKDWSKQKPSVTEGI